MKLNQLKTGAILSYISIILTSVLGMIVTPYVVKKLGTSEYGLYALIGALIGHLTLLDLGLNHTIIRFIAKYRAEKDKFKEEQFLGTSFIIYGFISLILVFIGSILYYNIDNIFANSMTLEEIKKAKIMAAILIFNLAITLPGSSFAGISSGYGKFVFPRIANIIKYLIRSITLVSILYLGADAIGIVILDTLMNVALITANAIYVFKSLKVKMKFHSIDKKLLKEIFSYSIWIFIFVIVSQFQWKVGQMVLGIKMNTKSVAIYSIGIMLGSYYGAFSSAITSVLLPKATNMIVKKSSGLELTNMMIRIGRISFIVLLYILGAFIMYGKQFIHLWVGNEYTESWAIALIIMVAYTIPLVQGFGHSILEAKNLLSFKALLYLSFLLIGSVFGIFLIDYYGATGMILGTAIGWFIAQNIMNIYYNKKVEINILRFFKELGSKTIIAMVFILIFAFIINFIPGNNWINFIIKATLYSIVYFSIMYSIGTKEYEQNLVKQIVISIKRRVFNPI